MEGGLHLPLTSRIHGELHAAATSPSPPFQYGPKTERYGEGKSSVHFRQSYPESSVIHPVD